MSVLILELGVSFPFVKFSLLALSILFHVICHFKLQPKIEYSIYHNALNSYQLIDENAY